MSYRVEISPSSRARCSATHCNKEGIQILKGEIRQGVMVTFQERQSWKYRHWGCVTPEVLRKWGTTAEMNMDLVDGYDTLPKEAQEKVKRALEQMHVDDEDWNGDLECNRYNPAKPRQGMFVKTPKKKTAENNEGDASSPSKKILTSKKRGRGKTDVNNEDSEEPAAKKAKGRGKMAIKKNVGDEEMDERSSGRTKGRGKKTAKTDAAAEDDAPPKRTKKATKPELTKIENDDKEISTNVKKPRTKKPKTENNEAVEASSPATKTVKKGRTGKVHIKASKADADEDDVGSDEPLKPQKRRKGTGKKTSVVKDD